MAPHRYDRRAQRRVAIALVALAAAHAWPGSPSAGIVAPSKDRSLEAQFSRSALLSLVVQVRNLAPGHTGSCTGVVLDTATILTAAHCVEGADAGQLTVRTFPGAAVGKAREIILSPDPAEAGKEDFAVIALAQPTLRPAIDVPAPRAVDDTVVQGELIAIGAGAPTMVPVAVRLPGPGRVVRWKDGQTVLTFDESFACPGDSGGPVLARRSVGYVLVGLIVDGWSGGRCSRSWFAPRSAAPAVSIVQVFSARSGWIAKAMLAQRATARP